MKEKFLQHGVCHARRINLHILTSAVKIQFFLISVSADMLSQLAGSQGHKASCSLIKALTLDPSQ